MRMLVALALLLAGCGGTRYAGDGPPGTLSLQDVVRVAAGAHVCLDRGDPDVGTSSPAALARPPLPDGTPVALVRCRSDVVDVPHDGQWRERLEETATAGVDALLREARRPDEAAGAGACPAMLELAPDVWAVDATGRAVRFRWPVDACGFILPAARQALDAVRWRSTATRREKQIASQAAVDSGCATAWKEMAAIQASSTVQRGPGDLSGLATGPPALVCVYRITDRGQVPTGTFARGGRPDRRAWQRIAGALARAPQVDPAACRTLGRSFAVVGGERDTTYVELDGCRRVLAPDGGYRQATDAVLAALATVGTP